MNQYQELSEAFGIFAKYEDKYGYISAEHDVIYAGPDIDKVTDEDKSRLAELGWGIDEHLDCFYFFT